MAEPAEPAPPPVEATTVPLRSRRRERALVAQKIQHIVPALGLLMAAGQALRDGAHGGELALALVEIVTCAALVISFARHLRAARKPHATVHVAHGVDWFDIFAAGVLGAEALERWHLTHHIARPTILMALATLGLGLFHGAIAARQARRWVLQVDSRGVRIGGKPFRTFFAAWPDIASIMLTPATVAIRTHSGRSRRLHLDDLHDSARVHATLAAAQAHLEALRDPPQAPAISDPAPRAGEAQA